MILEGAPASELYESEVSEQTAVQMEIDAILEGETITPLITDNHPLYIKAYRKLLYNPVVRQQSEILPIILNLIEQRLALENQMDPQLKSILRNEPMPPPQNPQGGISQAVSTENPTAQPTAVPAEPLA